MRTSNVRRGFTLIELLVVIAIIAILAAILFPVFGKARDKAKQYACINNQRQLAIAVNMYAQDNNDTLPAPSGKNPWSTELSAYTENAVFDCPLTAFVGTATQPEYGFNRYAMGTSTSGMASADQCPLTGDIAEPFGGVNDGTGTNADAAMCTISKASELDVRHAGGVVMAFADGHVQYVSMVGTSDSEGDPLLAVGVNLEAGLPYVFQQKTDYVLNNYVVPFVPAMSGWDGHCYNIPPLCLGQMTGGYKTNNIQPNIVIDYDEDYSDADCGGAICLDALMGSPTDMATGAARADVAGSGKIATYTLKDGNYTGAPTGADNWSEPNSELGIAGGGSDAGTWINLNSGDGNGGHKYTAGPYSGYVPELEGIQSQVQLDGPISSNTGSTTIYLRPSIYMSSPCTNYVSAPPKDFGNAFKNVHIQVKIINSYNTPNSFKATTALYGSISHRGYSAGIWLDPDDTKASYASQMDATKLKTWGQPNDSNRYVWAFAYEFYGCMTNAPTSMSGAIRNTTIRVLPGWATFDNVKYWSCNNSPMTM